MHGCISRNRLKFWIPLLDDWKDLYKFISYVQYLLSFLLFQFKIYLEVKCLDFKYERDER